VTGGEIYNYKLDHYLKARFTRVDNISWPNRPHRNALEFILNSLSQNVFNISLLKRFGDIDGNVVILERWVYKAQTSSYSIYWFA